MDTKPLQFGSTSSRRVLLKKLEVLQSACGKPKETVQEALLVASKLQEQLLQDLHRCPHNNLQAAHELQKTYIRAVEVTLTLLKQLDSFGAVMIGHGEFLPNTKLYSIEKWIQERFRYNNDGAFVWGAQKPLMSRNILQHNTNYIRAHHALVRIEYNTGLTTTARQDATRALVTILKRMVEPSAYLHAAGLKTSGPRLLDHCFLCQGYEEAVCTECFAELTEKKLMIAGKKIGNALMESLLRSKAGMVAKLSTGSSTSATSSEASTSSSAASEPASQTPSQKTHSTSNFANESEAEKESRRAVLANMKSRLEAIRRSNQVKQRLIESMRSQLALVEQDNSNLAPMLGKANAELEAIQARYESKKALLTDRQSSLREAKHDLLLRMRWLHGIRLHGVASPNEVPGHPRVRLPVSATGPPLSGPNQPTSSWHFLHHIFYVDGNLLRSMPHPTSTLIPFMTFLAQVASWWDCPLPYPIDPLPVPRIYAPSLAAPLKASATSTTNTGWHIVNVVSATSASEYDLKVHQLLAEDGRALIRAIGTFPEDAVDFSDAHWLNTLLWSLQQQYVHSFHNAVLTTASPLGSSTAMSHNLSHSQIDPLLSSTHRSATEGIELSTAPSPSTTLQPAQTITTPITSEIPSTLPRSQPPKETKPIPPSNDRGWLTFLR